jgi:hypothetical protein
MSSGLVNRPLCASRERFLWMLYAAEHLAAQIHEAPVWIMPCLEGATPTRTAGSSIYPAVQNMLLAARAARSGCDLDDAVSGQARSDRPFSDRLLHH